MSSFSSPPNSSVTKSHSAQVLGSLHMNCIFCPRTQGLWVSEQEFRLESLGERAIMPQNRERREERRGTNRESANTSRTHKSCGLSSNFPEASLFLSSVGCVMCTQQRNVVRE